MPAAFITLPTNRNTGTATSGKESSAYSVRCATRSSGRSFRKMYARHGIAIASTTGKPSMNSTRKARTTRKPSIAQVSTVCLASGRRRRHVCTSMASVSTTSSSEPTTRGAKNSQNGISSTGVTLFRLRVTVTTEATNRTPNTAMPDTSISSCRIQRGFGGRRNWNSSMRICPPSRVTYEPASRVRQIRKYFASSSAPASGTLNTPRMVICASGVTTSAARRTRLALLTADLTSSKLRHGALFHCPNLLDVLAPLGEVLVHLREHRLAEALDVEPVLLLDEHHALGLELLAVLAEGLAVPVERLPADFDHGAFQDLAVGRGDLLPHALVHEHREDRLHVPGEHHVLLHLVQLEVVDVGQGVLLPDDQAGGERGGELGHLHRRGYGAHAGQHRGPELDRHAAVLLALHVLDRQHLVLGGEVARALEQRGDDAHVALLYQLLVDLAQRRRQRRVGGAHRVVRIAVHERRVEHRGVGHDPAERAEVVVRHRDRARAHAVHHLVHAAELRVGEHLDLDAAVGALLHQLRHLVGVERLWRVRHAHVRIAQLGLCRYRERR